jgi:hypothetical protein
VDDLAPFLARIDRLPTGYCGAGSTATIAAVDCCFRTVNVVHTAASPTQYPCREIRGWLETIPD